MNINLKLENMKKVILLLILSVASLLAGAEEISYKGISLSKKNCGQIYKELVEKANWYGKKGVGESAELSITYSNLPATIKPIAYEDIIGLVEWNSLPALGIQITISVPENKQTWKGILEYYNHVRHALMGKYGRPNLNHEFFKSPYSNYDSIEDKENAYILGYAAYSSCFFDYDTRTSVIVDMESDWKITVTFRDANQEDLSKQWKRTVALHYSDM